MHLKNGNWGLCGPVVEGWLKDDSSDLQTMRCQSQFGSSCTMLQGMGLRAVNFANKSRILNPLVHTRGRAHGVRFVVAAATKVKPRIMRLKKDEIAQVLPWSGSGEQRLQKLGTPATWLARLAISLAGSVVFYNFNTTAAAVASLYWAWDPILSTSFANTSLRLQYPYAGLWRARVLSANVVKPVKKPRSDDVFQEIFESQGLDKPFLKLVIGDGSSATLEMKVGLPSQKNQQVRVGEAVEVLVLSDIKSLSRFMAVRDVYLPDVDLWLAEDPCLERPVFENLIEMLRASSSSTSAETPALKGRDTQARLPDSVDMIPGSSLSNASPEPQTARRWKLTQLDYEEFPNEFDEDPKLQALKRLGRKQKDGEFQRRAQAPPRQYMRMQEYSSDSEDKWEPESSDIVPNQAEASADIEDYAPDANEGAFDDDDPKLQALGRLGQDLKNRELPRSLPADAYGPPMQYMRMQEYGSDVEDRREQDNSNMPGAAAQPELSVGDGGDVQVPDNVNSEQLTTVDEFLGSRLEKMPTRESGVELVQEEEF